MRVLLSLLLAASAAAFDYNITGSDGLELIDAASGIYGFSTIFLASLTNVSVVGLTWEESEDPQPGDVIMWQTLVNGEVEASGNYSLEGAGRMLPTTIPAGSIRVHESGTATIEVLMTLAGSQEFAADGTYQVYKAGVAIIPLVIVFFLACVTRMVEVSLLSGIFIGACIIAGNLKDGFKNTLATYLVGALADEDHVFVVLFTLFLSGLVGMMQKSGGMAGATKDFRKVATTPRRGQWACFFIGCLIFFDDYASLLVAGESMTPLFNLLSISKEKLAFIVDGTSAPIASMSPISSWVGFEVSLIQEELNKIKAILGEDPTVGTSGFAVFLQSIKYRYYPIHMLVVMMSMIITGHDWGSMLMSERKCRVYQRKDGGDGKAHGHGGESGERLENQPAPDQPSLSVNMFGPVALLVFLIFYLLVQTGTIPGTEQTLIEKLQVSNSFTSLLWGTFGTTMCTILFYLLQIVQDGKLQLPGITLLPKVLFGRKPETEEGAASQPRFLLSVGDSVESFLYGMGRIFAALIILTLAWAVGSVMVDVGADRLFAMWIVDSGLDPAWLPTISFVMSFFMALATGTSWGTMSILFPLMLVPTYFASNGDTLIFNSTTAGVLSGAVAGDHVSPISDTTVISALATDCDLLRHVVTQSPYVALAIIISIVTGTIPIGFDIWPNMVGIAIGWGVIFAFYYFYCVPVINKTGRLDFFSELWMKFFPKSAAAYEQLRIDTVKAYNGEDMSSALEGYDAAAAQDDMMEKEAPEESPKELTSSEDDAGMVAVGNDDDDDDGELVAMDSTRDMKG